MKTADLYIRVSTDEQADKGYSQRSQAEVLMKYCEINDITVRRVIYEDHSAKSFERPEWKKLFLELKKHKGKSDLVLFTKWDRFSRNASDAYQMISKLKNLGVEPQAVEQPLDMSIPENKMMLAVYLTAPEIENDRRSLNVKHGMRQARKEGRWLGVAPPGYANKVKENGEKYVAVDEPQASHMRWAFERLADGVLTTAEIYRMAIKRGLKCGQTSFWTAIRNVGYCGRVYIAKYKDEEAHTVKGQHEALISETLFYKVQDVLDGRKREFGTGGKKGVTITSPDMLPLRGFLLCDRCNRMLTGSATKGRNAHFYYYHCRSSCGWRQKAETVNAAFLLELKKLIPKPGMAEVYREVLEDLFRDSKDIQHLERKNTIAAITETNNRITKARELLLTDCISGQDYKIIKNEAEEKLVRLDAKLRELANNNNEKLDIDGLIYKAVENFKKLDLMYLNADIEGKRQIIGSTFAEKWHFLDGRHRTAKRTPASELIYLINKGLRSKKPGLKTFSSSQSGFVPRAGIEPARFPTSV
ncbi:recombinase family protein [Olivibacter sp. XZL3]|uniref:recombinase family protein n=1 Tax=Olivibacter sp. XZL3 TaxID=1735116 RepID=UPI001064A861|nr:recombinase family protein [Olivibacter sp. XZL3]